MTAKGRAIELTWGYDEKNRTQAEVIVFDGVQTGNLVVETKTDLFRFTLPVGVCSFWRLLILSSIWNGDFTQKIYNILASIRKVDLLS